MSDTLLSHSITEAASARITELERELAEAGGLAEEEYKRGYSCGYNHGAESRDAEVAALREACRVALHSVGKVLHGEGKDFRDLDHTYKMLIDVLPREVIEQPHAGNCSEGG